METNFDEKLLEAQRVDSSFDEDELHQVLRIAIYDEYHAYNTYLKVINQFGEMKPFTNILQAEINHYSALVPLLEKYQVPLPIDNWYDKIEIPDTLVECCELGVAAEINNIKMYDNLLKYTSEYPDVTDVLYRLQAASYNNHLPAFRTCVQEYSSSQDNNPQNMINDFSEIAKKISSGNMNQEELMKLLTNTNMSFVGGLLLGGVGAGALTSMKDNLDNEEGN